MKEFKVPSRAVPSVVCLPDGSTVDGKLFVPSSGPSGAPGRLVDRLNDDAEHFLPLALKDHPELLNKDCIVWVRPADAADVVEELPPGSAEHSVRIALSVGGDVEGVVRYVPHPARSRLLDYFNEAPRFVAIDGRLPLLVNRRFMVRVDDLSREPSDS